MRSSTSARAGPEVTKAHLPDPLLTFGPTRFVPLHPECLPYATRLNGRPQREMEQRMILVDETASEACGGLGPVDPSIQELRFEADQAWRDDVALEMWIDVTSDPVRIRLAGVLDESTGANLPAVVEECVDQGQLDFELDTSSLRVKVSGQRVLGGIRDQIFRAGGNMQWDNRTASWTCPPASAESAHK